MPTAQTAQGDALAQLPVPFFSKSMPTSASLNAAQLPLAANQSLCFGVDRCNHRELHDRLGSTPNSAGVADLLAAFRATGGVALGNELAMMMQDLKVGDHGSLGRAMASREICSFQWRSAFWIPMFQFDLDNLAFQRELHKIMRELHGVFDDWMLTAWFARPNSWLGGHKPVDLLAANLPAVHAAARADRYVAAG